MPDQKAYRGFRDFYPDYLRAHQNRTNRRLHFLGTSLVILLAAWILASGAWSWLLVLPVAGYGFAWAGHLFFERNRPATFTHPLYSLMGDFRMYVDLWTGRIPF